MAFVYNERTLIVIDQTVNHQLSSKGHLVPPKTKVLEGSHKIGTHIYLNDWIKTVSDIYTTPHITPADVTSFATKFINMVFSHLHSLATLWFPGMIISPKHSTTSYVPCWKCYGGMEKSQSTSQCLSNRHARYITYNNDKPVYCFNIDDCIVPAALEQALNCPVHVKIDIMQIAPDLVCY